MILDGGCSSQGTSWARFKAYLGGLHRFGGAFPMEDVGRRGCQVVVDDPTRRQTERDKLERPLGQSQDGSRCLDRRGRGRLFALIGNSVRGGTRSHQTPGLLLGSVLFAAVTGV